MAKDKLNSIGRSEFSPLSLLRATWKNKWTALGVWAVLSLATVVTVYRLPSVYKAETLILVESQKIPEKLVSSTVNAELQDRLATISQEVLSATRLQGLIEKFGLYQQERTGGRVPEEIIETMRKDMSIKLERGWTRNQPGAFRVTYQGTNPETIAAVVNQIGNFFIEENLKAREEQATGTSEFLKAQMDEAKKGLEEQERKLSDYKRQHPGELPQQENSILGALANLHLQLQGNQDAAARADENKVILETTLSAAESSLASLMSASRKPVQADGTPRPSTSSPAAAPSDGRPKESDQWKAKLDSLLARYTDSYPEVQETRAMYERALQDEQVRALKAVPAVAVAQHNEPATPASQTAQAPPDNGPEYTPDVRREQERVATLRAQAAAAAKDLQEREAERGKILAEIASYQGRVENLPVREQEMAGVLRDYQISKANYEQLLSKNLSADMSTDMEKRQKAEKFTVLDVARIPEKPFKPMRPLFYSAGIGFALILGIAAAFVRELKRNVILGEWELPSDITILGRIPRIEFSAADIKNSPFTESA